MPGGGNFVNAAAQYGNWTLNDSGDVAFSALLDTDSLGLDSSDMGLYAWSGGSLRLVARTGMNFPGVGTLIKLAPEFVFGLPFSGALINVRGDIVFQGTFLDQNSYLTSVLLKIDGRAVDLQ